jgi:hypothetical protein
VTIFSGGIWSVPAKVGGALYSSPSCAGYIAGQVLCAARNVSGKLSFTVYNGSTWKAFANLTMSAVSAPYCTSDNNNAVICATFTAGGSTRVNRYAAGVWAGFLNIGGIAGGEPDCASLNSFGKVVCFAKAYNSGIFGNLFNGVGWGVTNWSGYGSLGGTVNDNASCVSHSAGLLVCGAIAVTDTAFYANIYNGSIWSGWSKIGGIGMGSPSCAPLGASKVVCAVMGINNKLTSAVGP